MTGHALTVGPARATPAARPAARTGRPSGGPTGRQPRAQAEAGSRCRLRGPPPKPEPMPAPRPDPEARARQGSRQGRAGHRPRWEAWPARTRVRARPRPRPRPRPRREQAAPRPGASGNRQGSRAATLAPARSNRDQHSNRGRGHVSRRDHGRDSGPDRSSHSRRHDSRHQAHRGSQRGPGGGGHHDRGGRAAATGRPVTATEHARTRCPPGEAALLRCGSPLRRRLAEHCVHPDLGVLGLRPGRAHP